MKTYTVRFVQYKPGSTKKVPVVTPGIEVGYGQVVNGMAVSLGAPAAKLWEVPLMKGNLPLVTGDKVLDCHPVPHREKAGRYLLAESEHDSHRVLVRILTEAGEQASPSGAVIMRDGCAVRVGYGYTANRQSAESVDILLDVHPGATLVVTAGGTGGHLHQRYLLEYNGELKILPLTESPTTVVAPKPAARTVERKQDVPQPTGGRPVYRKQIPVVALPDDLDTALEVALNTPPEELADTVGGRMKGKSVPRPGQMVMA